MSKEEKPTKPLKKEEVLLDTLTPEHIIKKKRQELDKETEDILRDGYYNSEINTEPSDKEQEGEKETPFPIEGVEPETAAFPVVPTKEIEDYHDASEKIYEEGQMTIDDIRQELVDQEEEYILDESVMPKPKKDPNKREGITIMGVGPRPNRQRSFDESNKAKTLKRRGIHKVYNDKEYNPNDNTVTIKPKKS